MKYSRRILKFANKCTDLWKLWIPQSNHGRLWVCRRRQVVRSDRCRRRSESRIDGPPFKVSYTTRRSKFQCAWPPRILWGMICLLTVPWRNTNYGQVGRQEVWFTHPIDVPRIWRRGSGMWHCTAAGTFLVSAWNASCWLIWWFLHPRIPQQGY